MKFLTIAAYKFIQLDRLAEWQKLFKTAAQENNLVGTILLSPEGINVMLSGRVQDITAFKNIFSQSPVFSDFSDLHYKEQYTEHLVFNRLFVKIKKEIIAFGVPSINPIVEKAEYIKPRALKNWLDSEQEIYIVDTRNDYEIEVGSFKKSMHLNIHHFRDFPKEAQRLDENLKEKIIVTVCTGGIRCEKAALLLKSYGFKTVYQLEGGILDYFKDIGAEHYQGKCFVFDKRRCIGADEYLT